MYGSQSSESIWSAHISQMNIFIVFSMWQNEAKRTEYLLPEVDIDDCGNRPNVKSDRLSRSKNSYFSLENSHVCQVAPLLFLQFRWHNRYYEFRGEKVQAVNSIYLNWKTFGLSDFSLAGNGFYFLPSTSVSSAIIAILYFVWNVIILVCIAARFIFSHQTHARVCVRVCTIRLHNVNRLFEHWYIWIFICSFNACFQSTGVREYVYIFSCPSSIRTVYLIDWIEQLTMIS